jgi:spore germination protein GerM
MTRRRGGTAPPAGRACLVATLILLAGCGVPSQDRPTVIDPTNVPNGLLASGRPEPASTPTQPQQANPVTYFVDADRLIGVRRELPTGSPRTRLHDAISALLVGPTETELAAGLSTAIPNGLLLTVAGAEDGEATIELTGELRNSPMEDTVLAVAQIVLTATAQPEIDRVRLTYNGETIEAPLIDGSLRSAPLTEADYADLRR